MTLKLAYVVHILAIVLLAWAVLKQVRFARRGTMVSELPEAEVAAAESILGHHDILLLAREDTAYELP